MNCVFKISVFFFFQAEDDIRDVAGTGVQTCALPISVGILQGSITGGMSNVVGAIGEVIVADSMKAKEISTYDRSEERRVGKECRSRRAPYH